MLVACKVTPKGFEPVFNENGTPIVVTLGQALVMKIEGLAKGWTFQPYQEIFDVEEITL